MRDELPSVEPTKEIPSSTRVSKELGVANMPSESETQRFGSNLAEVKIKEQQSDIKADIREDVNNAQSMLVNG